MYLFIESTNIYEACLFLREKEKPMEKRDNIKIKKAINISRRFLQK